MDDVDFMVTQMSEGDCVYFGKYNPDENSRKVSGRLNAVKI